MYLHAVPFVLIRTVVLKGDLIMKYPGLTMILLAGLSGAVNLVGDEWFSSLNPGMVDLDPRITSINIHSSY